MSTDLQPNVSVAPKRERVSHEYNPLYRNHLCKGCARLVDRRYPLCTECNKTRARKA